MRIRFLIVCLVVLTSACSEERTDWHGWPDHPSATLAGKKVRAETARDALAKSLVTELASAIGSGGPQAGIQVCNERASMITKGVTQKGLRIGRTSWKLRNPANKAPAWAQPFVDAKASKPILLVDQQERLHALYPIILGDQCVVCHGQDEQIPYRVKMALNASYPHDQARGFSPGDLRGWFWIEVD